MFIIRLIIALALLAVAGLLPANGETNSVPPMSPDFLKTNGEFVVIGNMMVETNSPLNTVDSKQYMWRVHLLRKTMNSEATNSMELLVQGAKALIKDYPDRPNGYQTLMAAADIYESDGKPAQARAVAVELRRHSVPKEYRTWAVGFLNRIDSLGKPVSIKFIAVDGRGVNLADMKGKVVLVDFWATTCGPCIEELPRINEEYQKFHPQGFEIIGVSCDMDKKQLEKFLAEKGYPWPQYFDGKQQKENKFAQGFGIDAIPHMFLIDKKGILRFDDVRASDTVGSPGDHTTFEEKISSLLAEN